MTSTAETTPTLSEFMGNLGLCAYKSRAKSLATPTAFPMVRRIPTPTPPPEPPKPKLKPEPRWLFLSLPEEAITHRIRGRARIAMPGELDGFGIWVPRWRVKRHGDGLVLPAKVDHEYTAEKAEKVGKKWKVVARKQLTRAAMAKLFPPVAVAWDDLGAYDEPDDPKWNHEAWVKTHVPEPLEREEREIRDELLMESEEASWQEADA